MGTACSGVTDPSKNVTETFSGSVQPNNFGPVHPFTITNSGELTVTVDLDRAGQHVLGVEDGQLAGSACGVLQQNAVSSANLGKVVITAQLTNKGTYCVQAFDPVKPWPVGPRRGPELHHDRQSSVDRSNITHVTVRPRDAITTCHDRASAIAARPQIGPVGSVPVASRAVIASASIS